MGGRDRRASSRERDQGGGGGVGNRETKLTSSDPALPARLGVPHEVDEMYDYVRLLVAGAQPLTSSSREGTEAPTASQLGSTGRLPQPTFRGILRSKAAVVPFQ